MQIVIGKGFGKPAQRMLHVASFEWKSWFKGLLTFTIFANAGFNMQIPLPWAYKIFGIFNCVFLVDCNADFLRDCNFNFEIVRNGAKNLGFYFLHLNGFHSIIPITVGSCSNFENAQILRNTFCFQSCRNFSNLHNFEIFNPKQKRCGFGIL